MKTPLLPKIAPGVYVDPSAQVIGRVKIGRHSSIWPGAILRGDIHRIEVGRFSNIQDLCVLHVDFRRACRVGDYVTVGHQVCLHACTVCDDVLIGMGSIVLDRAVIGTQTLLGAGSLVTQGQRLKPCSLYYGRPARWVRALTSGEIKDLRRSALYYAEEAARYLQGEYGRTRR
ncbi:MAG: gamma carbonic anhydrase family protein [Candidatus Omnitrophota bacterium]|jgi:carbonic anhydrase/acetyltransferase-like protein (isoleucine patch superfamily)